jgi:hypothetical protein
MFSTSEGRTMRRPRQGYRAVSAALAVWPGSIEDFVRQLDEDRVAYLSYTKLAAVESCEYGYLLRYVEGVELDEEPAYFVKGKAFHEAASEVYQQMATGRLNLERIERVLAEHFRGDDAVHLANALRLLVDNAPEGHEVVGTELPFVLSLGRGLPPLIGVIDLLLRRRQTFVVVDHKTGKCHYDQDELQLVLYREYVRRVFRAKRVRACFDEYRWVNNLDRIRKPAFRRTHVSFERRAWAAALERIEEGFDTIQRIEGSGEARSNGECLFCSLKHVCPEASVGYSSWW